MLVKSKLSEIEKFWNEHQDLRLSQVLISLNYLPNLPGYWFYKEDEDILKEQGINYLEKSN